MDNTWKRDIKPGTLLKCITTKLKHCDFNSVYTVAERKKINHGGWEHDKIRMEGSSHFVEIEHFAPVDIKEIRAEKLRVINGETQTLKEVGTGRKIDRNKNLDEKKFKIFEMLLTRWFTDRKRMYAENPYWNRLGDGYYSYEEFLEKIVKSDRIFDVTIEDFDVIKDMKVSEAFDLFIKMKLGKIK